jgi:hypothetical protein
MTSAFQPTHTCQAGERACFRPHESTLTRHYRRAQQYWLVVLTQGHAMARPSGSNACVSTKHMHATSCLHMLLAASPRQTTPKLTIAAQYLPGLRVVPHYCHMWPQPLPTRAALARAESHPCLALPRQHCLMHR